MDTIRFIDLFAGIAGFRYGLERTNDALELGGFRQEEEKLETNSPDSFVKSDKRQLAYRCVWSNEWDKYASSIYRKHYGECDTRDITTVPSSEIPDFDLLCAGFPCQSFSIAGKRKGFEDTRGTLFFEIARILADKRPRYFLLENVKGLLSHDEGKTFQTILGVLTDLGYEYQWQVLNSKDFGVPQNRERVFIIGHLGGESRPEVFPLGESHHLNSGEDEKGNDFSHTLQTSDKHRGSYIVHNVYGGFNEKENREFHDTSPTIRTPKGGGHIPMVAQILDNLKEQGLEPTERGWESLDKLEKTQIRRLTPTECERLQGYEDGWTKYGDGGEISDTQRYKCLGNAVTTKVITAIGTKFLEYLGGGEVENSKGGDND